MDKLYKVTLQKSYGKYGHAYVVAPDPEQAYQKYRQFLDKLGLMFTNDRGLKSVELIADSKQYGECETLLINQTEGK